MRGAQRLDGSLTIVLEIKPAWVDRSLSLGRARETKELYINNYVMMICKLSIP